MPHGCIKDCHKSIGSEARLKNQKSNKWNRYRKPVKSDTICTSQ